MVIRWWLAVEELEAIGVEEKSRLCRGHQARLTN